MITCSNIRAQGADYLTRHLSSNDYYSEGESIVGTWFGKGCESLGLVPGSEVSKEDFAAIGDNRKPDGSKLTALDMPDRKSWTDVQISAPKDVSILAMVGEDDRLMEAFEAASEAAMEAMQTYAGTRERRGQLHGSEETRITGNLIAARYGHDTSRALDPQMHFHYVVANATWDETSKRHMALQSRDMMLASKYARRVLYDHLAASCERMGYKVTNESDSGFNIEGVTDAMREKFSQREAQIDVAAKKFEVEHGREPSNKERAILTRESREQKLREITTAEVREYQRSRLDPAEAQALAGLVASAAVAPAAAPAAPLPSPADLDDRLNGALRHATERNSVVREWDALEAVYAFKPAGVRLDAAAVSARLVERTTGPAADLHTGFGSRLTTMEAAREEADTVRRALAGRGACAPLASLDRLDATQTAAEAVPGADRLAEDQLSAARLLAGNQDRVSVMIGDAGTGKTFMLQRLRDASEQPWIALGPTTRARDELKANGFKESETVAAFLQNPKKQAAAAGSVLLVDEAGLLDMAQMRQLFRVAEDVGARVLLCGDPKQHNAVGRGDALRAVLDGARHEVAAGTVEPYFPDASPKDENPHLDPLSPDEAKKEIEHRETVELTPEEEKTAHIHQHEETPTEEKHDHRKTLEVTPDHEKASNQPAHEFTTLQDSAARRPGLVVARLQTVRRQTSQEHREVSDLLAKGLVVEALDKQVNGIKTIEEVRNEKELFSKAADHYMERREALAADRGGLPGRSPDVLGVARTWDDIGRFSGEVRARMKERGQLGEDRQMQIVQPSGWTEEETTVAARYKAGQHVVTFQAKSETIGAKAGENWAVEAVEKDGLTLRRLDEAAPRQGQKRQASPRPQKIAWDDLRGVEVGELKQIPLAPGDSIQFRANCRDGKKAVANNGDVRQIKSIGKDGRLNLVGGGQVPAAFRNVCHGYAVTSHKSQGASVKETVVVMGAAACGSADVQSNYVNMTRHKDNSRVFVADVEAMKASLVRSAARGPGRELVAEMPVAPTSTTGTRKQAERRPADAKPAAASVAPVRLPTPAAAAKVGEPAAPVAGKVSPLRVEDGALRPMAVAPAKPAAPAPGSVEAAAAAGRSRIEAAQAARGPSVFGAVSTGKANTQPKVESHLRESEKPAVAVPMPAPAPRPDNPEVAAAKERILTRRVAGTGLSAPAAPAPAPAPVVPPAPAVAPAPVQADKPAPVAKPAGGIFGVVSSVASAAARKVGLSSLAKKIEGQRAAARPIPAKPAVSVPAPAPRPDSPEVAAAKQRIAARRVARTGLSAPAAKAKPAVAAAAKAKAAAAVPAPAPAPAPKKAAPVVKAKPPVAVASL